MWVIKVECFSCSKEVLMILLVLLFSGLIHALALGIW